MEIINDPKYIDFSTYEEQIEIYKKNALELEGVYSIYLMGSIKAPGLSDIDVIVVVEDDFNVNLSSRLSVLGLDVRVFLHGPIVIPISLADSIQQIFYASNLKCIYGVECLQEWKSLEPEKRKLLSVCYLMDFIESRFLQYANIGEGPIDKRAWLTRIWSTIHSLSLYRIAVGGEAPNYILNLEKKIKLTREVWFKSLEVNDEMFVDALDASSKINNFIFNDVLELYYGNPILKKKYTIKKGLKKLEFKNSIESPDYNIKSYSLFGKTVGVVLAGHSPRYLAHLQGYMELKPSWEVLPIVSKNLEEIKKERSELVASHATWLMEHARGAKSMKGYLGINTTEVRGVKSTIKKLLTHLVV